MGRVASCLDDNRKGPSGVKTYFASLGPWVPVSILIIWVALLPRMIPDVRSADRGIFVSVAERLLAGDALYRDVWDNKDPLFYFSLALGRAISPYADIVIEVSWVACSSVALLVLARWLGVDSPLVSGWCL